MNYLAKNIILSCSLFLFLHVSCFAQLDPPYRNTEFNEEVQTVLFHPVDDSLAESCISLSKILYGLQLSFDVLNDNADVLYYTFIHCTYDWQPSDIQKIEYLSGYESEEIDDFAFSLNTLTNYVHYELTLPTENMLPKLSGNYLLVVYIDDLTAENIYFTRRFMVVDDMATIAVNIPRYPDDLSGTDTKHQLDITVNCQGISTFSPETNVNLVIRQNGRWDNAVFGLKPSYVYPNSLSYDNNPKTVFGAGNKYRRFDISDFEYQSERIRQIIEDKNYWRIVLWDDQKRSNMPFVYEQTLNGKRAIRSQRDQNPDVEGDYAWVDFFLAYDAPLTHEDVYVIGELNNWNLDVRNRMAYNYERRGYEKSIFLKQGYYNYIYGVVERGQTVADVGFIEGDFWENYDTYTVYVYLKKPGTTYDQLIGVQTIVSH